MEYLDTVTLENDLKKYERKVNAIVESTTKNLLKNTEKIVEKQLINLQQDVDIKIKEANIAFQNIIYTAYKTVFDKHYKDQYSWDSLVRSVTFFIDDDFRPHINNNSNLFTFNANITELRRSFNFNLSKKDEIDRNLDFLFLEALDDDDFYSFGFSEEDIEDYSEEEIDPENDVNPFKNKKVYIAIQECYKEAKADAMKEYFFWLSTTLAPFFKEKYGIQLRGL